MYLHLQIFHFGLDLFELYIWELEIYTEEKEKR